MPQGSKAAYSDKQKRQAGHIEESYEKRGVSAEKAKARAWATVNRQTGGGKKKKGSGTREKSPAAAERERSAAAKRAAVTRKKGRRPRSFPRSKSSQK